MTLDATIYQPTIREIRGSSPIIVELGDIRIADDLEGLREFAADLTRRLDDIAHVRREAELVRSLDRPVVPKLPTELVPGNEFFLEALGWRRAEARQDGGCVFGDVWGETGVLTTGGHIIYLPSEKPVLVAVPECERSVMEQAS